MAELTGKILMIKEDGVDQFVIVLKTGGTASKPKTDQFQLNAALRALPEIRSNIYGHARHGFSLKAYVDNTKPTPQATTLEFSFDCLSGDA